MLNQNKPTAAHSRITTLEAARNEARVKLQQLESELEHARAEARRSLQNGDVVPRLAQETARLRDLIAAAPRTSYTAERARELLAFVESPSCTLDTVEKLSAVRDTVRDFKDRVQYADPTRIPPGWTR